MADGGTDKSNLEQLSVCARTVDDDLNVDKDFLGFCGIDNTESETDVKAIKDILMRCSLNLDDCSSQTCNGSSLAVKSLTKEYPILQDTVGTVGEICVLVKYSAKREKMLDKLTENVERTFNPDEQQETKLDKLCVTRWTIRANCLKKDYSQLRAFAESLEEKLDAETSQG